MTCLIQELVNQHLDYLETHKTIRTTRFPANLDYLQGQRLCYQKKLVNVKGKDVRKKTWFHYIPNHSNHSETDIGSRRLSQYVTIEIHPPVQYNSDESNNYICTQQAKLADSLDKLSDCIQHTLQNQLLMSRCSLRM